MTTLGNFHHDFPRLAKQSGYFFQLYRGRVNWTDIENLNIDELVENRNFQLLEQHLLNVVNCNLEREYDLKILDQKFVKLFKLAQLGVDYLQYVQLYLDRCVVLLQEQLIAHQEECDFLKEENEKKSEELKKLKRKNRNYNYQCEKCEKVFISDVYLKFHDKRRHSNPATPKSLDRALTTGVNSSQQTENERKITIATQTATPDKDIADVPQPEDINKINKENDKKIENLEKELEDLKIRLKKAEATLTEKTEVSYPNSSPAINFQSPVFYPTVLPFIPSYFQKPSDNYYEVNSGCQIKVPEFYNPIGPTQSNIHPAHSKTLTDNSCQVEKSEEKIREDCKDDSINEEKTIVPNLVKTVPQEKKKIKVQKIFDHDKENRDPKDSPQVLTTNSIKPTPFPRNPKRMFSNPSLIQPENSIPLFFEPNTSIHPDSDVTFSNQSITRSSTPIKETEISTFVTEPKEDPGLVNERETNSIESLHLEETIPVERKSKSFIKKMVSRKPHKLKELSKSWKRSLNNLYDSVSSSNKDHGKIKDSKNSKADALNGLNAKLRELGVDPEWTGIPNKTLKQKLKALKHTRKLIAKEHPMYPTVRQNIEKTILKKLTNPLNFTSRKEVSNKETNEEESIETQSSSKTLTTTPKKENFEQPSLKPVMYDIESESESEDSPLEQPQTTIPAQTPISVAEDSESESEENVVTAVEKEFDFSVFQVGREAKNDNVPKKEMSVDERYTDSDFDDDFLEEFSSKNFKTMADYLESKTKNVEKVDKEETNDEPEILQIEEIKTENQKSTQSKQHLIAKKKVLFADYLNDPKDDLWSLKSSWEAELG